MKSIKQVLAFVILIVFSFSNISFASEISSFKLSPPSSFSSLNGEEFKDAAQIMMGVKKERKRKSPFKKAIPIVLATVTAIGGYSHSAKAGESPRPLAQEPAPQLYENKEMMIRYHIRRLSADDEKIREDAITSIINIGKEAVPALIEMILKDKDCGIREFSASDQLKSAADMKAQGHVIIVKQYQNIQYDSNNNVIYNEFLLSWTMPNYGGMRGADIVVIRNGKNVIFRVLLTEDADIKGLTAIKEAVVSKKVQDYIAKDRSGNIKLDLARLTGLDVNQFKALGISNAYDNRVVQNSAILALGRIGDRQTIPFLVKILQEDKDAGIREAAKEAIKEIKKANAAKPAPQAVTKPATQPVSKPRAQAKMSRYSKPSDDDIRLMVSRIKEAGVEIFIPKSQFPGNTTGRYRAIIESIGGSLRVYQYVEDLQTMIKTPAKSIIMTSGISDVDAGILRLLKDQASELRLMNFAKMDDIDKMTSDELDNYEADIFSILLLTRVITPEDFQDKGSPTYRMLSHLLEDYMPEELSVENYIEGIVTNADRLIKTILKALPITVYRAMRQSVEVLWSA
ncbi:MAG: HEAT repeat domain-containing protein [Candidatus Omnitrophota bacterium]|nr:HEAT repeat domain-containing protein [Candidatus Omnitrophota bacterium]